MAPVDREGRRGQGRQPVPRTKNWPVKPRCEAPVAGKLSVSTHASDFILIQEGVTERQRKETQVECSLPFQEARAFKSPVCEAGVRAELPRMYS